MKLSATVSRSLGKHTYSFAYSLLGKAAALSLDSQGNLASDLFTVPAPTVYGADHQKYPVGGWSLGQGNVSFSFDDSSLPSTAYPYVLDPSTTFYITTSGDDGQVLKNGPAGVYPPTNITGVDVAGTGFIPQRVYIPSSRYYVIQNALARWNTSTIPDDAAVSSATLQLWVGGTASVNNRAMTADWYTAWPIDAADYSATAQTSASGASGWPINSMATGVWDNFTLVGAGTNVSKTGYTGLRLHISGGQPTGDNYVSASQWDGRNISPPAQFVVNYALDPTLDSPSNGATVPTATPVLKATTDAGDSSAIDYNFQVSDNSTFSGTATCAPSTSNFTCTSGFLPATNTWTVAPGALKDGDTTPYYWRAQARVQSGQTTGWSATGNFYVRALKLGTGSGWPVWTYGPIGVNEANGNLITSAPGPSYQTSTGPMSAAFSYNSLDASDHGFGAGWTLQAGSALSNPPAKLIDHSLLTGSAKFDAAEVVNPDGGSDFYTHVGTSNAYQPPPGFSTQLTKNADGTWTLVDEDGSIYSFGTSNGATGVATLTGAEIEDATAGASKLTYAFSPTDPTKVTSITDNSGRTLTFTWYALNPTGCASAILCVAGPDGVTWRFVGDGSGGTSGRLARVNNGTRDLVAYAYDPTTGHINKIQNANDLDPTHASPGYNAAHALTMSYDTSGRVVSVTDGPVGDQTPSSAVWTLAYHPGSVSATPTRAAHGALPANSPRTADGYTTLEAPMQQGQPSPKLTKDFYDNLGYQMETDDPLGNITEVSYNTSGQVLWSEDAKGNPTDNAYDSLDGELLTTTGPAPTTGGSRPVTTYRYDEKAIGTSSAAGPALTGLQASYFKNVNLAGRADARQNDSTVDFSNWGTTGPAAIGGQTTNFSVRWTGDVNATATGNYTFYTYADDGTRLTVDGVVAINDWTSHAVRTDTSPVLTLTAGWHKVQLDYYQATGAAEVHLKWSCTVTSSLCNSTPAVIPTAALRPAWLNQTSTVDPVGRVSFHHFADPASGHPDYDLVQVNSQNLITSYSYDLGCGGCQGTGRMTQKVMPNGNSGRSIDASGNLTGSPNLNFSTTWTYYAPTDTATIPAACGVGTAVNQAGLLKSVQAAGLAVVTTVYDVAGRAIAVTNGTGTTCSGFDAEGRSTYTQAPGESQQTVPTYDPSGVQLSVTDASGTVSNQFDEAGRPKQTTDSFGNVSTFAYDADGNLLTRTSMGYQTTLGYDAGDELTGLTDAKGEAYAFSYDARGMLHTTLYPNGTFSWTDFNNAGWPTAVYNRHGTWSGSPPSSAPSDASPIADYTYTYNLDGKIASEVRSGGGLTTETTTYNVYDNLGRLQQVTLPTGVVRVYGFDLDSNRTSITENNVQVASYAYSPTVLDQLMSITQGGTTTLGYTSDGQQNAKGSNSMTWDGRARMSGGTFGGTAVGYGFDASGRQRQRVSGSSTIRYVYADGGAPLYQTNGSGTITESDIEGPGGDLVHYAGPPTSASLRSYEYFDARGNLGAEADSTGTRTAAYTYDPFGAPLQSQPANTAVQRWKGQHDKLYDTQSALIAMGARQYDPSIGRFLSVDPVEGGSLNIYEYAGQDPINNQDLNGNCWGGIFGHHCRHRWMHIVGAVLGAASFFVPGAAFAYAAWNTATIIADGGSITSQFFGIVGTWAGYGVGRWVGGAAEVFGRSAGRAVRAAVQVTITAWGGLFGGAVAHSYREARANHWHHRLDFY